MKNRRTNTTIALTVTAVILTGLFMVGDTNGYPPVPEYRLYYEPKQSTFEVIKEYE